MRTVIFSVGETESRERLTFFFCRRFVRSGGRVGTEEDSGIGVHVVAGASEDGTVDAREDVDLSGVVVEVDAVSVVVVVSNVDAVGVVAVIAVKEKVVAVDGVGGDEVNEVGGVVVTVGVVDDVGVDVVGN
jgi:hypothetical protein